MRRAISPRLAMSSERNMASSGGARCHARLQRGKHQGGMVDAPDDMVPGPPHERPDRVPPHLRRRVPAGPDRHPEERLDAAPADRPPRRPTSSSTGLVIGALGRLGSFVVWAVWAAAASCYLYFLGEVVAKSKVKLDEFGRSVGAYFWSVANLFFVFWVASLVIELMVPGPQQAVFAQLLFLGRGHPPERRARGDLPAGEPRRAGDGAALGPLPPGELDRVGHPQSPLPRRLVVRAPLPAGGARACWARSSPRWSRGRSSTW